MEDCVFFLFLLFLFQIQPHPKADLSWGLRIVVINSWVFTHSLISPAEKKVFASAFPANNLWFSNWLIKFTWPSLCQSPWLGWLNVLTGLAQVMSSTQSSLYHIQLPVEKRLNVIVFPVHAALGSKVWFCLYSKDNRKAQRFVIFLNHFQWHPDGWMNGVLKV